MMLGSCLVGIPHSLVVSLPILSVASIPINEIYNQIIFTTKDIKPNVIKIGMLHSTRVINKVLQSLEEIKIKKYQYRFVPNR